MSDSDLMFKNEIQELVAEAYRALDEPDGPATRYYTEEQLALLPEGARRWALGVGNPLLWGRIEEGMTVVDLGCGSGIDVILAAHQVGPGGRAIGVDLLPEMIERAEALAAEAGLDNTEFLRTEMEDLPLPDDSVDVVSSNGAINLSARKSRVLAEAHRVLRPGGQLVTADLTINEEDLPPEILTHPSAWAG